MRFSCLDAAVVAAAAAGSSFIRLGGGFGGPRFISSIILPIDSPNITK